MSHNETLRLLFPTEIIGVFDDDILLEGKHLDAAQASAERLLLEMHPDQAYDLLTAWERVCGLNPKADAPLQSRRDAILRKLRERGGLSRAYFIDLAASFGWVITIDELSAFMAGWNRAGDHVYLEAIRWIWQINVFSDSVYSFRSGLSAAGERLAWWVENDALEALFEELKPAHTMVFFRYI
jgi:uncharacterized protein YmfQ (DUF2313 family)